MSDWNHFFSSLRKYLDYFRAHLQAIPTAGLNGHNGGLQTVSDNELAGLLSWTNFATAIALKDPESRRQIYEERSWNCIETVSGLLASPVPLVLKGALYKLLAALAIDEVAAVNIWNCLLSEGICVRRNDGNLTGIQQELDERESQVKIYDCSQGFLTLAKELFSHKTRPGTQQIAPYLQYIVNSILCQCSTRSYADSKQMWQLAKISLDTLYELLKTFYATPATVENKVVEVHILTQMLSDSPLSRTLLQIITEGAFRIQDESCLFCSDREAATCSAIRLLFVAISNRAALADAIRAANSNIMLVSIESILFAPLPHPQQKYTNYMAILFQYVSESDQLLKHTFFIWQIVKEALAQRPSLQSRIIQALLPRRSQLITSTASLSIFSLDEISVAINDLPPTDVDALPHDRIKGELCRLIFEVFNDAMELDPDTPNVAYTLMNFNLQDLASTMLEIPSSKGEGVTCLHNILEIIIQLVSAREPLQNCSFSGLYEPALRLILRMCSVRASSSSSMLRFLRTQYDLIYRLASSQIFREFDIQSYWEATQNGNNGEYSLITAHKSLQGITLELIALELSALLKMGHIEQPQRYLRILLSSNESVDTSLQSTSQLDTRNTTSQEGQALLWALLNGSRIFVDELEMPQCNKFDPAKVEELLSLCVRKNSCNIDQFDVLYLHLLLNSEINCIMNTEIELIREEAKAILDYCVGKNARNLLEGACSHLLEGWLSLVNVLSVHAPLPIIDIRTHQHLLIDALFLLRDYCGSVEMSAELAASLSTCMARIVRTICSLFANFERIQVTREALLPILHLILQCLVLPGYNKSVAFKVQLYASCLRVLDLFSHSEQIDGKLANGNALAGQTDDILNVLLKSSTQQKMNGDLTMNGTADKDPMVALVRHERIINDLWIQLVEPLCHEVVQTFTSDIVFAPFSLKMLATATFADLLREDRRHTGKIAREFIFNGSSQCVEDILARLESALQDRSIRPENATRAQSMAAALRSLVELSKTYIQNPVAL